MADLAELTIRVKSLEVEQAERRLKDLDRSAQGAERSVGGLSGMLSSMITALTAAAGATTLLVKSLQTSAEFEQTNLAFETLLGNTDKAKAFVQDMVKISKETPFSFKGLADSVRLMLALGFAAEDTLPMLTTLGDATSALGKSEDDLKRMVLALGQMQSKGKVSAQEMNQLAEAGIGAWKYLADAIGVDIPKAMKLAESGAIQSAQAVQAILSGIGNDPKFKDAMKKQAQTLKGLWSTFMDELDMMLKGIGDNLVEIFDLKDLLKELTVALTVVGQVTVDVIRIFAGLNPKFAETAQVAQKIVDVLKIAGAVITGLLAMALAAWIYEAVAALWALTAACMANPILAIPALVTGSIGAIITALILLKDEVVDTKTQLTLGEVVIGSWDALKNTVVELADFFNGLLEHLTGVKVTMEDIFQIVAKFSPILQAGIDRAMVNRVIEEQKKLVKELEDHFKDDPFTGERGPMGPQLPTSNAPVRITMPDTNDKQLGNMRAQIDAMMNRGEMAGHTRFLQELHQEMAKFRKDNQDVYKSQVELNKAVEEYEGIVTRTLKEEAAVDVQKQLKDLQDETDLLRVNVNEREERAAVLRMEREYEENGLAFTLVGFNLMRRYTEAIRDNAKARGDEAFRVSLEQLTQEIELLQVAEPLRDREAFRVQTLKELMKEYGGSVVLANYALKQLLETFDELQRTQADDDVKERIKDLEIEAQVLSVVEERRDRANLLLQTERDLLKAYGGDADLAAAALNRIAEAYDKVQIAKGNDVVRNRVRDFDEDIAIAGVSPEEGDRMRFIMEEQRELMRAFGGDAERAAEAMDLLVSKYDALISKQKIRGFVDTFTDDLRTGVEDALWAAFTDGDWRDVAQQVLMTLARDAFHAGFAGITGGGGSGPDIFAVAGNAIMGLFGAPAAAPTGGAPAGASLMGGETAVPNFRNFQAFVYNVPDKSTADMMAGRMSSKGKMAVVAGGSGTPGVTAGTLKPRRRGR